MGIDSIAYILVDASPLISVLKLGRFDLLEILTTPLACTDFVQAEIKRPQEPLKMLLSENRLKEIPIVDPSMLLEVEQLYQQGLGRGEASSILLAHHHGYPLILDDKQARKKALLRQVVLYSTAEIIVRNIKAGVLTVAEADDFILQWRLLGEYPVSCTTFNELL